MHKAGIRQVKNGTSRQYYGLIRVFFGGKIKINDLGLFC